MSTPVVTVASGGIAVTEVANGLPIAESASGGFAVTIVAAGGLGVTYTIPPGPSIQLSASSIAEDATSGTTVGTLSVINGSGSYTFTETADPDSKFAVSGSNLNTAAALDYETATSHSVTIQADNGVDTPISRTFTITVTDVSEGGFDNAFTFGGDFYTYGGDAYTYGAP